MNFAQLLKIACIAALCILTPATVGYGKDPYKVLGVDKGADDAAIKRAYKKLALKYHPDKNPKGQGRFIEIQQAYEILSDADKKRQYDIRGGPDGAYHQQHHQHEESSRFHRHHRHQQHFHDYNQQQQHYHFYQQQQQQQEQMYERVLPSNTSFLTASNFRSLVMYGGRPWLIMVYVENSAACRDLSPTWETLWKSLGGSQAGGGNRDGASVGLGRIHARFQRNLVHFIARGGGPFSSVSEGDMPLLAAVPAGCADVSCFVRYRGPLRLSALQDFVADRLLNLPRVPQLQPHTVAAFLRLASPYKVAIVAFGRGGGSGSLALRMLAQRQKDMLTVARGHVQEGNCASAAAWQAALALSSPPAAGQVVFLRGPGTSPRTLEVPAGKAGELQQMIDEEGLLWQEVPPLRPATGASLGCLWGRAAAASGRPLIDTCVLAVAPRGPALEAARRRMARLGRYLANPAAKRDPSLSSAAAAYMDGKLRLVWLDSSAQQPLCAWLLGRPGAMRPTNTAPPPGTNAAGRAAAAAQAMAAAAARSPDLVRAVCGPAPLHLLARARRAAAAAAAAARLPRLAAALAPDAAAHVVLLRPSTDSSSWFRGGALHMRHGRPVFLHAVNADFNLAADVAASELQDQHRARGAVGGGAAAGPDLDLELPKLAAWVNQMHSNPERHLHISAEFPPTLLPDDELGALEFVAGRFYEGAMVIWVILKDAAIAALGGKPSFSDDLQGLYLAVLLGLLLLLQMPFRRRGDARAAAPRDRAAAAPAAANVQRRRQNTAGYHHDDGGRTREESRDGDDAMVGAEGADGRGRTEERNAAAAPLNRPALSPFRRSSPREEVRGSSDGTPREGGGGGEGDGGRDEGSGSSVASERASGGESSAGEAAEGDAVSAGGEAAQERSIGGLREGNSCRGGSMHGVESPSSEGQESALTSCDGDRPRSGSAGPLGGSLHGGSGRNMADTEIATSTVHGFTRDGVDGEGGGGSAATSSEDAAAGGEAGADAAAQDERNGGSGESSGGVESAECAPAAAEDDAGDGVADAGGWR